MNISNSDQALGYSPVVKIPYDAEACADRCAKQGEVAALLWNKSRLPKLALLNSGFQCHLKRLPAPGTHLAMQQASHSLKDGMQVHVALAALVRDEQLLGRGHQALQLAFADAEGRSEGFQALQGSSSRRAGLVPVEQARATGRYRQNVHAMDDMAVHTHKIVPAANSTSSSAGL